MIAIGAFGGVTLAGVALVDWHYALRYVGTVGAQLSLINWLRSYDNPQVCSMHEHPGHMTCCMRLFRHFRRYANCKQDMNI